ncbi:MAG: secondary thiamine-phosphate synthase enzyme YjbQ [Planctomycetota bacterium]
MSQTYRIDTRQREEMIDITEQVAAFVTESGLRDGWAVVTCPHTTAGLTINENADPDVQRDILHALRELIPVDMGFQHFEHNSDAHLKSSLMGAHTLVPVEDGRLALGRWQGVYLCEFDGPKTRSIRIGCLAEH